MPTVIVAMEGGILTSIVATHNIKVVVIDYDYCRSDDYDRVRPIPQGDGRNVPAYCFHCEVEVKPERAKELVEAIEAPLPTPPPPLALSEGMAVVVGEEPMHRDGILVAPGPRGGWFVRTNLGEVFYEANLIRLPAKEVA